MKKHKIKKIRLLLDNLFATVCGHLFVGLGTEGRIHIGTELVKRQHRLVKRQHGLVKRQHCLVKRQHGLIFTFICILLPCIFYTQLYSCLFHLLLSRSQMFSKLLIWLFQENLLVFSRYLHCRTPFLEKKNHL